MSAAYMGRTSLDFSRGLEELLLHGEAKIDT
jgi:hypothetical protein